MLTRGRGDMAVSNAAQSVWAKYDRDTGLGLSLLAHLKDACGVAERIWDEWLPDQVIERISEDLPGGRDDGRALVRWLSGVHDIGKATTAFAIQSPPLADRMRDHGLTFGVGVAADRQQLPHALAGQHIVTRWLIGDRGWPSKKIASTYSVVVGGHHGVPPTDRQVFGVPDRPHLLGDGQWAVVRTEILDEMAGHAGVLDRLAAWSGIPLPYPAQVLVTAVVIVADWIASNPDYFPYQDPSTVAGRVVAAWEDLALTPPWRPVRVPASDEALFADRFRLPPGCSIRPAQQEAMTAARQGTEPQLIVIEAPMGDGKTEAALACAEILAARHGSGGVFVALPTMATSDAMFRRVKNWLELLPTEHEGVGESFYLAHGKSALNKDFRDIPWGQGPQGIDIDGSDRHHSERMTAVAVAHSWLRGRKKGPLSSFVVGTIDQVLFGALRSKHLALRHLALAGKVVIVDEVHAVDVYMNTYLTRVLEWLGAYGVPTVLLSATLPAGHRRQLVQAYDQGRAAGEGRPVTADYSVLDGDIGYPVVIASTGSTPAVRPARASARHSSVRVEPIADDDNALLGELREALRGGGCAAVVRNTVQRAQDTAVLLRREFGADVLLLHSRFIATHRAAREERLRNLLGPPNVVHAAGLTRPRRLILIGTQVIEQSLDIDVDLMITDLAPVDLILQRIGRLHRHARGAGEQDRPAALREPRCLIAGVVHWSAEPPQPVSGSRRVYGQATLLRSCIVLRDLLQRRRLDLPGDIAPLVQAAYSAHLVGPEGWSDALTSADTEQSRKDAERQVRAQTFRLGPVQLPPTSLIGWLADSVGEVDDTAQGQAQVRDTEESVEVIAVQRIADQVHLIDPYGRPGRVVATDGDPGWALAREVAQCTLRLPYQLCTPRVLDAVITDLERTRYPGWGQSPWLGGQLVLELDADLTAVVAGHHLRYDPDLGLQVRRADQKGQT